MEKCRKNPPDKCFACKTSPLCKEHAARLCPAGTIVAVQEHFGGIAAVPVVGSKQLYGDGICRPGTPPFWTRMQL